MFKPRFWYYTEDLNMRMMRKFTYDEVDMSSQRYNEDDLKYYQELQHYGLSIHDENDTGSFRFIHLMGSMVLSFLIGTLSALKIQAKKMRSSRHAVLGKS